MMNVFVINRKKDIGRKEYIIQHFKEKGIERYSFFEAVEGRDLDSNFIKRCNGYLSKTLQRAKGLNVGEIGCALSHLEIYKKIVNEGLAGALIFEDDVEILKDNLLGFVEDFNKQLSENVGYICHLGEKTLRKSKVYKKDIYQLKRSHYTYSYYIDRIGAERMLRAFGEYPYMSIDSFKQLIYMKVIKLYGKELEPQCKMRHDFASTIDNAVKRQKANFFIRTILRPIRSLVVYLYLPIKFKMSKNRFKS
ncbi:glycosyltransferase family 25 protein [Francisella hispaniensis]|uniref:Putative beta1,4-galactosyltransferase n=1 Tax=Francisella hispaniensis TaxID=622488 RepID=F4BHX9_9GAMM|nr:glycosyltransferase family 25 protein [Francisella hispaniensis]AEE27073.1 putative beta1,4-galactosyltransferase [Francisella hispaniensis]